MRGIFKCMIALALLASALMACSGGEEAQVSLSRLDLALRDISSADSVCISEENAPGARLMFRAMGYDSITPELLQWWSTSTVVAVFQHDVDSLFTDLSPLRRQLASITAAAKEEGIGLPDMKFYTIVWGKPQPLMRDSDVMIIALNHYLGADYPGYSHWPQYRRSVKTPQMLPYDIAAALVATQLPFPDTDDATLSSWMLYEGALVHACMLLVEDADLATALGYSNEQLARCDEHYDDMMREIALRRMLYDTDPMLIDRMLTPAPNSPLLGGRAPSRIGRYIGYRMVQDYLKDHPDATIRQLITYSLQSK